MIRDPDSVDVFCQPFELVQIIVVEWRIRADRQADAMHDNGNLSRQLAQHGTLVAAVIKIIFRDDLEPIHPRSPARMAGRCCGRSPTPNPRLGKPKLGNGERSSTKPWAWCG